MQKTQVRSLGQEDPLEKEMPNPSTVLAWRIPWTEEPVGLQSVGSQRVGREQQHIILVYFNPKTGTFFIYQSEKGKNNSLDKNSHINWPAGKVVVIPLRLNTGLTGRGASLLSLGIDQPSLVPCGTAFRLPGVCTLSSCLLRPTAQRRPLIGAD